jgi:hypothetical protein
MANRHAVKAKRNEGDEKSITVVRAVVFDGHRRKEGRNAMKKERKLGRKEI